MRIHQLSVLDAVGSLKSTEAGLSRPEVERRLHEYGRNKVEKVTRGPLWLRLAQEFRSLVVSCGIQHSQSFGRSRARWACGQAAFEPVHMPMGRCRGVES